MRARRAAATAPVGRVGGCSETRREEMEEEEEEEEEGQRKSSMGLGELVAQARQGVGRSYKDRRGWRWRRMP